MTHLCPECLVVYATHPQPPVPGVGFTNAGVPVSDLPRAICPDCRTPKRGNR